MIALGSLFENLKNIYFYYPGAAVLSRSPNAISTPSLFILHNPARLSVINYLRGGLAGYLTTSSGPSCGIKCQLGMKTWCTVGGVGAVDLLRPLLGAEQLVLISHIPTAVALVWFLHVWSPRTPPAPLCRRNGLLHLHCMRDFISWAGHSNKSLVLQVLLATSCQIICFTPRTVGIQPNPIILGGGSPGVCMKEV